ncbi:glycoside hydrolase family 76 protein [Mucilaginibacter ginkgonis]|uniref:Hydrolase n=1 Tax=Mucilaginibacter ginkgonis TaxID=2682091 RepID=A0A6I4HZW5_9SPHI|nr:glycoside hydrolase family 76 protein [Mucilaginibacter ginkgonis]QQL49987.1 hydrolase [Mucilaginibacter ginkgonis]
MRKHSPFQILFLLFLFVTEQVSAQSKTVKSELYAERAKSIYSNIWTRFRVKSFTGLFLENYPGGKSDSLNYFQGSAVKERQVSFLWPFSGVFSATNVLMRIPGQKNVYKPYQDSLIAGIEQYLDVVRKPEGYQAYPVKLEKSDRYYDDNGLVGIDYMESYFNTKNPVYLARAKNVFRFIMSGWTEDLGGGVFWVEGHPDQKPACSNGMALLTSLKIYEGCHEKYYLDQGKKFYNWMYTTLRDSTTGMITNDIKPGKGLNRTFWSYNTGSLIEAAVMLYRFTGKESYLIQAKALAKDSHAFYKAAKHDEHLTYRIDLPWFMAVLFRGYEALYKVDKNDLYISALEHDINYAWENSRDKFGLVTHSWTTNPQDIKKPKWLLDEACIAEIYGRLSVLR